MGGSTLKQFFSNKFVKIKSLKTSQKIKLACLLILCISFLFSSAYIFRFYYLNDKNNDVYKNIENIVDSNNQSTDADSGSDAGGSLDFEQLWEINPDIYAYIKIPGTDISYPIAQSKTDNEYYLNHTVEGVYGYPGSIYTENYNTKTFSDTNTVIYGHNMNNGTMFAQLFRYSDKNFFEQNQYIYITLPEKTLKFHIFAALMFDDRHILASYNFRNSAGLSSFISDTRVTNGYSNYNDSIQIGSNDRIITLSTCMPNNMPENRWIVEAVLENE